MYPKSSYSLLEHMHEFIFAAVEPFLCSMPLFSSVTPTHGSIWTSGPDIWGPLCLCRELKQWDVTVIKGGGVAQRLSNYPHPRLPSGVNNPWVSDKTRWESISSGRILSPQSGKTSKCPSCSFPPQMYQSFASHWACSTMGSRVMQLSFLRHIWTMETQIFFFFFFLLLSLFIWQ